MLKTLSTNKLTNHPAYAKILHLYNERLKQDGKVNNLAFYRDVVSKEIPDYSQRAWYHFVNRFKSEAGLIVATPSVPGMGSSTDANEIATATTLLSNNEALQQSIAHALNISAAALKEIIEKPELIPAEKRAELFLKVMKAQDSRVKAIGAMRADNRQQEAFDRAMDSAAYG